RQTRRTERCSGTAGRSGKGGSRRRGRHAARDLHDRSEAGRHLARLPRPPEAVALAARELGTTAVRLATFLQAVSTELAPASPRFFDDVAAFEPTAEVYDLNTKAVARTARRLIDDGMAAGAFREVHAMFAADVISSVMVRVQRRQVASANGLSDAEAYRNLADLLLHGLTR
ncbi:hypothetical protein ABZ918_33865, partial [Streptomyces viridosporus]